MICWTYTHVYVHVYTCSYHMHACTCGRSLLNYSYLAVCVCGSLSAPPPTLPLSCVECWVNGRHTIRLPVHAEAVPLSLTLSTHTLTLTQPHLATPTAGWYKGFQGVHVHVYTFCVYDASILEITEYCSQSLVHFIYIV